MKIRNLITSFLLLTCAALTGCGGGGDTPATVVTGTVMAGPVALANVTAFAVTASGVKGAQLGLTTSTSIQGVYSINVGGYTGPLLLEVTGGTYTDEATGALKVPTTLRAAVTAGSGNNAVNITPLTELAVKKMPALNTTVISSVNKDIGDLFKVTNITGTTPVVATGSSAATTPGDPKVVYGLVLAALSQLLDNQGPGATLDTMLVGLATDVTLAVGQTPASLGAAANSSYKAAMADFIVNPRNTTGVTTLATAPLNTAAAKVAILKISTAGTQPENIIGADFSFTLPLGASVATTGSASPAEAAAGTVVASGVAANGITIGSTYAAANRTVRVLLIEGSVLGFGVGELVTVVCSLPAGSTLTEADFLAAAAFAVTNFSDLNGVALPAPLPTLSLTATIF